jgi:hypothetical protein
MDEQKKEDDSGSVGERLEALEIELKRIKGKKFSINPFNFFIRCFKFIFSKENIELVLSISALVISIVTAVYLLLGHA